VDRFLLGSEAMAVQGFPMADLKDDFPISEPQLFDLAGNAISLPVILSIYISAMAHGVFADDASPATTTASSSNDRIEAMLGNLGLLSGED